jgi:uncharacterized membrane protein YphA (DoxX/SURF4 family)
MHDGQLGYSHVCLKVVGIVDDAVVTPLFYLAKGSELLCALLLIVAGLMSIVGIKGGRSLEYFGALLGLVFMLPVSVTCHTPSTADTHFMKNLQIIGALLFILASSEKSSSSSKSIKKQ